MKSCRETWEHMTAVTAAGPVRNYIQVIDMSDYEVATELFPRDALRAYTAWNLELDVGEADRRFFAENRGGQQGDYRQGTRNKIANVVDCLSRFPASKRAVITISNTPDAVHETDADAKCMREIHFYRCDGRLDATVLFRAQAAAIFPKNIHFIGALMSEIASRLPGRPRPGQLFYLATMLVPDRT